jgi:DNA-binding transcriptional regulator YiaG
MKKQYESELLMVCHQMAEDWHRAGKISDAEMREYDEGCLVSAPKPARKAPESKEAGHPITA